MNAVSLLAGITLTTFAASGVFFLKFWKASRDPFFIYFCFACWLIALERVVAYFVVATSLTIYSPEVEATSWVYLIRLLAFALISIAILKKTFFKDRKKATGR